MGAIQFFTWSNFSHVAVVICDPPLKYLPEGFSEQMRTLIPDLLDDDKLESTQTLKGKYLLEASSNKGVKLRPLRERLWALVHGREGEVFARLIKKEIHLGDLWDSTGAFTDLLNCVVDVGGEKKPLKYGIPL